MMFTQALQKEFGGYVLKVMIMNGKLLFEIYKKVDAVDK
jgi:hypothetical protein